jgi:XTP/dITP diphosphohydrolase
MTELVFATNNRHKLEEIQHLLGDKIHLLSLTDIGCFDDIPENQPTLEGNAAEKSFTSTGNSGKTVFRRSGLEIEALVRNRRLSAVMRCGKSPRQYG